MQAAAGGRTEEAMDEGPRLITVPEAARVLGLGRSKTWQLVQRGELPVVRIGRSVRVPTDALATWVRRRTEGDAS
jgi:excisionase family DNA binding protein